MDRRTFTGGALAAAFLPFLVPARGMAQTGSASTETVAGVISTDRALDTLASLLIAADMEGTLQEPGPYTVFAPTNDAFDALGEATLMDLASEENIEKLRRLLMHHVAPTLLMPADLNAGRSVETLAGTKIEITNEDTLLIGGAELLKPGRETTNGVVHKISAVLEAPEDV